MAAIASSHYRRFEHLSSALHSGRSQIGRQNSILERIELSPGAASSSGAHMAPRGDWDSSFAPKPLRQTMARCRAAIATRDVTPPPGIYNRNWGAAPRDTSTGNHGELRATALAFAALEGEHEPLIIVNVDLGWLLAEETAELCAAISAACGVTVESGRLLVQMTHTHAGPSLTRPFTDPECPGGQIALTWWAELKRAAAAVASEAAGSLEPVWLSSALGSCNLAQQQEFFDRGVNDWVSTYNPDYRGSVDDTLVALRLMRDSGDVVATLCNYGCHPQTLGPANSLVSADWPGTTRVLLEKEFGGTAMFLLGACGDTGPIEQKQADILVTERLGRKVGYATASALETLHKPATELRYSGPIVSGAVIALWPPHPMPEDVIRRCMAVRSARHRLQPALVELGTVDQARAALSAAEERLRVAQTEAETKLQTALCEQARRNLRKVQDWKSGAVEISVYVWQIGEIFFVACPGEPYAYLQTEIRRRVSESVHVVVMCCTNGSLSQGYLLPTPAPAPNSYQHRIAVVGEGGLELVVDTAVSQINKWWY